MKERRKIKRRYLMYYVRVYDATSRQQIGNLVDITALGAMVLSDTPIPVKQSLRLRVELTEDVAEKPFMEANMRVTWCHPDIDPALYNIGFQIEKIAAADKKIIQRIVEIYGFRDNQLAR
jgi:hypothetical protein